MEAGTAVAIITLGLGTAGAMIKVLTGINITLAKLNTTMDNIVHEQSETSAHVEALRVEQELHGKVLVKLQTTCKLQHGVK